MTTLALPAATISSYQALCPVEQAVLGFLARYRGSTLRDYTRDLKVFLAWCDRLPADPLQLKRGQLEMYVRQLQEDPRGYSESTINRRVLVVKLFYKYATIDEYIDRDPTAAITPPPIDRTKQHRTYLNAAGLDKYMQAAAQLGPKHNAVAHVLAYMAMRVGELCSLNVTSLTTEGGYQYARFIGKGNKAAIMRMEPPVAQAVHTYLDGRTTGPLFITEYGNRCQRNNIARLVTATAKAAGVRPDLTPHGLRRSAATVLLDLGTPITEVQGLLRHSSVATTMLYDQKATQRGAIASGTLSTFMTGLSAA